MQNVLEKRLGSLGFRICDSARDIDNPELEEVYRTVHRERKLCPECSEAVLVWTEDGRIGECTECGYEIDKG
jgi:ribosomal protein S27AE